MAAQRDIWGVDPVQKSQSHRTDQGSSARWAGEGGKKITTYYRQRSQSLRTDQLLRPGSTPSHEPNTQLSVAIPPSRSGQFRRFSRRRQLHLSIPQSWQSQSPYRSGQFRRGWWLMATSRPCCYHGGWTVAFRLRQDSSTGSPARTSSRWRRNPYVPIRAPPTQRSPTAISPYRPGRSLFQVLKAAAKRPACGHPSADLEIGGGRFSYHRTIRRRAPAGSPWPQGARSPIR